MLEIPGAYELLWALSGALLYRISCLILNYARASLFFKEIITRCLILTGGMVEHIAFMQELKYQIMHQNNLDEEQIKFIKQVDEKNFRLLEDRSHSNFY